MDATQTLKQEFQAALESLETCLMTPRVPGEMVNWLQNVKAALASLGGILARILNEEHRTAFKQIRSQDSDLHSRVDGLKQSDVEGQEIYQALSDRLQILLKGAPKLEPDEGRLESDLVSFSENGLKLISHLRKQEVAIDTWQQEAFQRDRGISG